MREREGGREGGRVREREGGREGGREGETVHFSLSPHSLSSFSPFPSLTVPSSPSSLPVQNRLSPQPQSEATPPPSPPGREEEEEREEREEKGEEVKK